MNNPVLADPSFVEWSTNRIPLHRMGQPEEKRWGRPSTCPSDSASFRQRGGTDDRRRLYGPPNFFAGSHTQEGKKI